MKATTTPEGGPDAKTAFYAEQLALLEIVPPDDHAPILDGLERLEDPPEHPAASEPDESPLSGGPSGHDLGGADLWLPPDAYSAAVWETACAAAEAVS